MSSLRSTILLFMILCLMSFFGYHFASTPAPQPLDDHILLHIPDLSIHTFKMLEFDELGQLSKEVISDRVIHVPDQNQYLLHEPHIHFRGKENSFYYLLSNSAKTKQGFEQMIFNGHVLLQQPQSKETQAFTMLTETLTYLPKKEQAFTTMPVEFNQVGHVVHAHGMQADLKTNHITLHEAKAELQPKV
jgi:LPS export ABC transporter protein LptC